MFTQISLARSILRLAEADADRLAVVVEEHRYSRADVAEDAGRLAAALVGAGVGPGDRVAVMRRNAALHLVATIACSWIGAIVVPLNFRLPAAEAAGIIADCTPKVVICGPLHAEEWDADLPQGTGDARWVVDDLDPIAGQPPRLSTRWTPLSSLRSGAGPTPDPVVPDPGSELMILYTSGSTGYPKGVRLTHRNVWASWANMTEALPITPQDVTLAVAPFSHVGGINTFTLQAVVEGGTVVVQRRFDVHQGLLQIEEHRVNSTFGVPAMYRAMSLDPAFDTTDLSSLRVLLAGGAPAPTDLVATFRRRGLPLTVSWGMTETTGGGTVLRLADADTHPGSVGTPNLNTEVLIADYGTDAPITKPGRVGELLVRGANVTPGYWGRAPEAFLPDGWFRSGDFAMRDAEGFVYLMGRSQEVIISGGENIYPAEIENHLAEHPAVADVAVVGVPDLEWGETPLAFVVPRDPQAPPELAELRDFLTPVLARFKLPRRLRIMPVLPHGPTGKVDRAALRALVSSDPPSDTTKDT